MGANRAKVVLSNGQINLGAFNRPNSMAERTTTTTTTLMTSTNEIIRLLIDLISLPSSSYLTIQSWLASFILRPLPELFGVFIETLASFWVVSELRQVSHTPGATCTPANTNSHPILVQSTGTSAKLSFRACPRHQSARIRRPLGPRRPQPHPRRRPRRRLPHRRRRRRQVQRRPGQIKLMQCQPTGR